MVVMNTLNKISEFHPDEQPERRIHSAHSTSSGRPERQSKAAPGAMRNRDGVSRKAES